MNIQDLFTLTTPEPSSSLVGSTLRRITMEGRWRSRRKKLLVTLVGVITPLSVLGLYSNSLIKDIGDSGILTFIALIISNPRDIISIGSDFFLTLAQSLPVTSMLIALVPTLAILWTLKLLSIPDRHSYEYSWPTKI